MINDLPSTALRDQRINLCMRQVLDYLTENTTSVLQSVLQPMHVKERQLVWEREGKANTWRVAAAQQSWVPGVPTSGVGGCVGSGCCGKS